MKKIIGWVLLIWGFGGIIVNLVFVFASGAYSWVLVINTLFCLLFIFGGWRLTHPKPATGGMIR